MIRKSLDKIRLDLSSDEWYTWVKAKADKGTDKAIGMQRKTGGFPSDTLPSSATRPIARSEVRPQGRAPAIGQFHAERAIGSAICA